MGKGEGLIAVVHRDAVAGAAGQGDGTAGRSVLGVGVVAGELCCAQGDPLAFIHVKRAARAVVVGHGRVVLGVHCQADRGGAAAGAVAVGDLVLERRAGGFGAVVGESESLIAVVHHAAVAGGAGDGHVAVGDAVFGVGIIGFQLSGREGNEDTFVNLEHAAGAIVIGQGRVILWVHRQAHGGRTAAGTVAVGDLVLERRVGGFGAVVGEGEGLVAVVHHAAVAGGSGQGDGAAGGAVFGVGVVAGELGCAQGDPLVLVDLEHAARSIVIGLGVIVLGIDRETDRGGIAGVAVRIVHLVLEAGGGGLGAVMGEGEGLVAVVHHAAVSGAAHQAHRPGGCCVFCIGVIESQVGGRQRYALALVHQEQSARAIVVGHRAVAVGVDGDLGVLIRADVGFAAAAIVHAHPVHKAVAGAATAVVGVVESAVGKQGHGAVFCRQEFLGAEQQASQRRILGHIIGQQRGGAAVNGSNGAAGIHREVVGHRRRYPDRVEVPVETRVVKGIGHADAYVVAVDEEATQLAHRKRGFRIVEGYVDFAA